MNRAEGPWLNEQACSSFIGRWNIPLKHSCTLGELCHYFAKKYTKNLKYVVVPVKNYERGHIGYDFNFTPTSPAIKDVETALLYPGMGLLEGINVNEGRGTEQPFKKLGAPWLNNELLLQKMQNMRLPGVGFNAVQYIPESGLYAGETCYGVSLKILQKEVFEPVKTGVLLLKTIISLHPNQVEERLYRTHANPTGANHLDKLLGIPGSFQKLKSNEAINLDVPERWTKELAGCLLY
ncbi:MAG: DUF1343 domain-containing protein [Dinghuibacter sp.]|nr:DUF1343 domain-containing protein [Dinghuibacter sp.]